MPKISVIIPTYNSSKGVCETLDSIINQKEFDISKLEIIVVDNNSTDDTKSQLAQYQEKLGNLSILTETRQGSYAARNKGISNSNGKVLCFIDADVILEPEFFKKLVYQYEVNRFYYVGFNVNMLLKNCSIFSIYDAIRAFNVKEAIIKEHFTPTLALAIDASVIEKVGMFDEELESGGDVVFGKKVHQAGITQDYYDNIMISHFARGSYSALVKKAKRVARGYASHMMNYPNLFNHEERLFKRLKFYLPNNPFSLFETAKSRNIDISLFMCIILSFIHIPLSLHQRKQFYRTIKELKSKAN